MLDQDCRPSEVRSKFSGLRSRCATRHWRRYLQARGPSWLATGNNEHALMKTLAKCYRNSWGAREYVDDLRSVKACELPGAGA